MPIVPRDTVALVPYTGGANLNDGETALTLAQDQPVSHLDRRVPTGPQLSRDIHEAQGGRLGNFKHAYYAGVHQSKIGGAKGAEWGEWIGAGLGTTEGPEGTAAGWEFGKEAGKILGSIGGFIKGAYNDLRRTEPELVTNAQDFVKAKGYEIKKKFDDRRSRTGVKTGKRPVAGVVVKPHDKERLLSSYQTGDTTGGMQTLVPRQTSIKTRAPKRPLTNVPSRPTKRGRPAVVVRDRRPPRRISYRPAQGSSDYGRRSTRYGYRGYQRMMKNRRRFRKYSKY